MDIGFKMGTEEFEKVIFVLDQVPTVSNIESFAIDGNLKPERLDEIAWFLPAYLSDDFNLFFIFAPNLNKKWTITCSKVEIIEENTITHMSNVVPTGSGLNAVAHLSKSAAVNLLAYLETLAANRLGHFDDELWRWG